VTLRVVWSERTHTLSLAVRVRDHFTGAPVPLALVVGLTGAGVTPVSGPAGGRRQPDGTYRFVGVPDGDWPLTVADETGAWRFPAALPTVHFPRLTPATPIEVDAWPTPAASLPPGLTVLRGRVLHDVTSAPLVGVEVRVDQAAGAFGHTARTDGDGEFVFVVAWSIPLDTSRRVPLVVQVTGHTVDSVALRPAAASPGAAFSTPPGEPTRLVVRAHP
jgi:hypothetical protein